MEKGAYPKTLHQGVNTLFERFVLVVWLCAGNQWADMVGVVCTQDYLLRSLISKVQLVTVRF